MTQLKILFLVKINYTILQISIQINILAYRTLITLYDLRFILIFFFIIIEHLYWKKYIYLPIA